MHVFSYLRRVGSSLVNISGDDRKSNLPHINHKSILNYQTTLSQLLLQPKTCLEGEEVALSKAQLLQVVLNGLHHQWGTTHEDHRVLSCRR